MCPRRNKIIKYVIASQFQLFNKKMDVGCRKGHLLKSKPWVNQTFACRLQALATGFAEKAHKKPVEEHGPDTFTFPAITRVQRRRCPHACMCWHAHIYFSDMDRKFKSRRLICAACLIAPVAQSVTPDSWHLDQTDSLTSHMCSSRCFLSEEGFYFLISPVLRFPEGQEVRSIIPRRWEHQSCVVEHVSHRGLVRHQIVAEGTFASKCWFLHCSRVCGRLSPRLIRTFL